jgi:hypothetical protein
MSVADAMLILLLRLLLLLRSCLAKTLLAAAA